MNGGAGGIGNAGLGSLRDRQLEPGLSIAVGSNSRTTLVRGVGEL
ncbi:MAG: hypothetical protein AAFQ62_15255 [Pseudomonadota bacterium]